MTVLLIELETKGHHISSYVRSIIHSLVNDKKKNYTTDHPRSKKK